MQFLRLKQKDRSGSAKSIPVWLDKVSNATFREQAGPLMQERRDVQSHSVDSLGGSFYLEFECGRFCDRFHSFSHSTMTPCLPQKRILTLELSIYCLQF